MNRTQTSMLVAGFVVVGIFRHEACNAQAVPDHAAASPVSSGGPHDFDFEFGDWQVHHHTKRDGRWIDFEGTSSTRVLIDGSAHVEENKFLRPAGVSYGIAMRAYDPKTRLWAIWWVDGRDPHGALDPPMKGQFVDGVGTFYSDSVVNGKTTRTRFIWSHITASSARWEQALSSDLGKTWDTNWVMQFTRSLQSAKWCRSCGAGELALRRP
ncbi:MAG: hypothetical protein ABI846_07815 [Rudaea sp.]